MPNPGVYHGLRLKFMMSQNEEYEQAVLTNMAADCVADIQRRFFKRFPVEMNELEEPSEAELEAVDDNVADKEAPEPDESLPAAEYAVALNKFNARTVVLGFRRDQIKRWLRYRYDKKHGKTSTANSTLADLSELLLAKLNGKSTSKKPRQPIPYNLWSKEEVNSDAIDAEVIFRRAQPSSTVVVGDTKKGTRGVSMNLHSIVTREMFGNLPADTQALWTSKAIAAGVAALAEWKKNAVNTPSTKAIDRQRCIEGIVGFAQPILDLLCAHTGMKSTLLVGGPEPADGGRLNIISVHSGSIKGPIRSMFGQSERVRYKEEVIPLFSAFLKKCYSKEDCRQRALSTKSTVVRDSLRDASNESASFHHAVDTWGPQLPMSLDVSMPTDHQLEGSEGMSLWNSIPETQAPPASQPPSVPIQLQALPVAQPSSVPMPLDPVSTLNTTAFSTLPLPAAVSPSISKTTLVAPLPPRTPRALPRGSIVHSPTPSPSPPPPHLLFSPRSRPAAPLFPPGLTRRPSPGTAISPLVERFEPPPRSTPTPVFNSAPAPGFGSPSPSPGPGLSAPAPGFGSPSPSPVTTSNVPAPGFTSPSPVPEKSKTKGTKKGAKAVKGKGKGRGKGRGKGKGKGKEAAAADEGRGDDAMHEGHEDERMEINNDAEPAPTLSKSNKRTSDDATPTQPSKRRKFNAVDTPLPNDSPPWLVSASGMLRAVELGDGWTTLLRQWEAFEVAEGSDDSSPKLASGGRPVYVSDWIQRARNPKFRLKTANYKTIDFMTWWTTLQPAWRQPGLARDPGEYEILRKPGKNGIISAVAGLFLLGTAPGPKDGWEDAVEEMSWVFHQLSNTRA